MIKLLLVAALAVGAPAPTAGQDASKVPAADRAYVAAACAIWFQWANAPTGSSPSALYRVCEPVAT